MRLTRRRALAGFLIGYGIAGLVLIVLGAMVGFDLAARLERLSLTADETIGAAARATSEAADAFDGANSGLERGGESADAAATLARDASVTLDALSDAMSISLFGTQPLIGLADDFATSAEQARSLADTLGGVSDALDDSRTDLDGVSVELHVLASRLEEVRDSAAADAVPPVRAFVVLLLVWLAVQSVAAVLAGAFLLSGRPG